MTSEQVEMLRSLVAHLPPAVLPPPPPVSEGFHDPLVNEFVFSMLLWESSLSRAREAMVALVGGMVDYNELRVSLPEEIVSLIGDAYPRGLERALRVRAALNGIYGREYAVTLTGLSDQAKREVRAYLASLEGVPAFVAARMALIGFGAHAFPVDGRVIGFLSSRRILPVGIEAEAAAGSLEHALHAGEILPAHLAIEQWLDADPTLGIGAPRSEEFRGASGGTVRRLSVERPSTKRRGKRPGGGSQAITGEPPKEG